jgi:anti-anti-sigma factor
MGVTAFRPSGETAVLRARVPLVSKEGDRTVVWLNGEYDIATLTTLAEGLATAISLDDANLVVDLTEVVFIDAATIGMLMRARNFLRPRSRQLTLRNAQGCVERVFAVCGIATNIDSEPAGSGEAMGSSAPALRSWVPVPPTDRAGGDNGRPAAVLDDATDPGPAERVAFATTNAVDCP